MLRSQGGPSCLRSLRLTCRGSAKRCQKQKLPDMTPEGWRVLGKKEEVRESTQGIDAVDPCWVGTSVAQNGNRLREPTVMRMAVASPENG